MHIMDCNHMTCPNDDEAHCDQLQRMAGFAPCQYIDNDVPPMVDKTRKLPQQITEHR
jgi:hypothetical protein